MGDGEPARAGDVAVIGEGELGGGSLEREEQRLGE